MPAPSDEFFQENLARSLAQRAKPEIRVSDPQGHVSEKWTRFPTPNDAPFNKVEHH
jgi:hypothetical protein